MARLITLAFVLLMAASLATAQTPWPESAKLAYVERCAESMLSQGLPSKTAKAYCFCIADGMSKEFGMEEYDQMMKAQPKPNGSAYDRRLYKVFSACSFILPQ